jgi:hypothetical protein
MIPMSINNNNGGFYGILPHFATRGVAGDKNACDTHVHATQVGKLVSRFPDLRTDDKVYPKTEELLPHCCNSNLPTGKGSPGPDRYSADDFDEQCLGLSTSKFSISIEYQLDDTRFSATRRISSDPKCVRADKMLGEFEVCKNCEEAYRIDPNGMTAIYHATLAFLDNPDFRCLANISERVRRQAINNNSNKTSCVNRAITSDNVITAVECGGICLIPRQSLNQFQRLVWHREPSQAFCDAVALRFGLSAYDLFIRLKNNGTHILNNVKTRSWTSLFRHEDMWVNRISTSTNNFDFKHPQKSVAADLAAVGRIILMLCGDIEENPGMALSVRDINYSRLVLGNEGSAVLLYSLPFPVTIAKSSCRLYTQVTGTSANLKGYLIAKKSSAPTPTAATLAMPSIPTTTEPVDYITLLSVDDHVNWSWCNAELNPVTSEFACPPRSTEIQELEDIAVGDVNGVDFMFIHDGTVAVEKFSVTTLLTGVRALTPDEDDEYPEPFNPAMDWEMLTTENVIYGILLALYEAKTISLADALSRSDINNIEHNRILITRTHLTHALNVRREKKSPSLNDNEIKLLDGMAKDMLEKRCSVTSIDRGHEMWERAVAMEQNSDMPEGALDAYDVKPAIERYDQLTANCPDSIMYELRQRNVQIPTADKDKPAKNETEDTTTIENLDNILAGGDVKFFVSVDSTSDKCESRFQVNWTGHKSVTIELYNCNSEVISEVKSIMAYHLSQSAIENPFAKLLSNADLVNDIAAILSVSEDEIIAEQASNAKNEEDKQHTGGKKPAKGRGTPKGGGSNMGTIGDILKVDVSNANPQRPSIKSREDRKNSLRPHDNKYQLRSIVNRCVTRLQKSSLQDILRWLYDKCPKPRWVNLLCTRWENVGVADDARLVILSCYASVGPETFLLSSDALVLSLAEVMSRANVNTTVHELRTFARRVHTENGLSIGHELLNDETICDIDGWLSAKSAGHNRLMHALNGNTSTFDEIKNGSFMDLGGCASSGSNDGVFFDGLDMLERLSNILVNVRSGGSAELARAYHTRLSTISQDGLTETSDAVLCPVGSWITPVFLFGSNYPTGVRVPLAEKVLYFDIPRGQHLGGKQVAELFKIGDSAADSSLHIDILSVFTDRMNKYGMTAFDVRSIMSGLSAKETGSLESHCCKLMLLRHLAMFNQSRVSEAPIFSGPSSTSHVDIRDDAMAFHWKIEPGLIAFGNIAPEYGCRVGNVNTGLAQWPTNPVTPTNSQGTFRVHYNSLTTRPKSFKLVIPPYFTTLDQETRGTYMSLLIASVSQYPAMLSGLTMNIHDRSNSTGIANSLYMNTASQITIGGAVDIDVIVGDLFLANTQKDGNFASLPGVFTFGPQNSGPNLANGVIGVSRPNNILNYSLCDFLISWSPTWNTTNIDAFISWFTTTFGCSDVIQWAEEWVNAMCWTCPQSRVVPVGQQFTTSVFPDTDSRQFMFNSYNQGNTIFESYPRKPIASGKLGWYHNDVFCAVLFGGLESQYQQPAKLLPYTQSAISGIWFGETLASITTCFNFMLGQPAFISSNLPPASRFPAKMLNFIANKGNARRNLWYCVLNSTVHWGLRRSDLGNRTLDTLSSDCWVPPLPPLGVANDTNPAFEWYLFTGPLTSDVCVNFTLPKLPAQLMLPPNNHSVGKAAQFIKPNSSPSYVSANGNFIVRESTSLIRLANPSGIDTPVGQWNDRLTYLATMRANANLIVDSNGTPIPAISAFYQGKIVCWRTRYNGFNFTFGDDPTTDHTALPHNASLCCGSSLFKSYYHWAFNVPDNPLNGTIVYTAASNNIPRTMIQTLSRLPERTVSIFTTPGTIDDETLSNDGVPSFFLMTDALLAKKRTEASMSKTTISSGSTVDDNGTAVKADLKDMLPT